MMANNFVASRKPTLSIRSSTEACNNDSRARTLTTRSYRPVQRLEVPAGQDRTTHLRRRLPRFRPLARMAVPVRLPLTILPLGASSFS